MSKQMAEHRFSLALENAEVVVLTKERAPTVLHIQVGETMILSKTAVKYVGIVIDMKLSFFEQILNTVDKAMDRMFVIC